MGSGWLTPLMSDYWKSTIYFKMCMVLKNKFGLVFVYDVHPSPYVFVDDMSLRPLLLPVIFFIGKKQMFLSLYYLMARLTGKRVLL